MGNGSLGGEGMGAEGLEGVQPFADDDSNSSLGGSNPIPPVIPTTKNFLVGARPGFYSAVKGMADAAGVAPELKAELERLLNTPVAEWVGGGEIDRITRLIRDGKAKNAVPVAVLYNIPNRDLGQHSGGGAANATEYKKWIDDVTTAIGNDEIVLIVEPDALAHMATNPNEERAELLAYALKKVAEKNPNATAYLDAGTAGWPAMDKATRALNEVKAKGATIPAISLNVSNFYTQAKSEERGTAIATALGQPNLKVMVDNSRNGLNTIPPGEGEAAWCNPSHQKLGALANTLFDKNAKFEQMFIKTPGESDGNCGIARDVAAGVFSDALLLWQLGQR